MSSFKSKRPKLPPPKAPIPVPEEEDEMDVYKRLRKRGKGRADTVLTGALEPMDLGQRSLLG